MSKDNNTYTNFSDGLAEAVEKAAPSVVLVDGRSRFQIPSIKRLPKLMHVESEIAVGVELHRRTGHEQIRIIWIFRIAQNLAQLIDSLPQITARVPVRLFGPQQRRKDFTRERPITLQR